MKTNMCLIRNAQEFAQDERGTTAIEYALIAAIIGVGLVTSLNSLSTGLTSRFTQVAGWF